MSELSQSNIFLEAVFKSAIDGIIIINEGGIIKMVNPMVTKLFGYEAVEMIGKNVHMLMGSPHKIEHDGYINNYVSTGIKKIIGIGREVEGKRKDGTTFPFSLSISEAFVGEERFFSGVVHDISALKEAEANLKEANANLENLVIERTQKLSDTVNQLLNSKSDLEATRKDLEVALNKEKELGELKSRFVSLASHEFRTPLSTILSSASIIEKYGVSDKQIKHTKKIQNSVKNLTGILNDFLSLGKIEEGKIRIKVESFDLIELIHDVVEELNEFKKKDQIFKLHLSADSCAINTDINLLRNIIINLISNACKYSGDGEIKISQLEEGEMINISVKDNGIGIPENQQKFLFDRFFRAENTGNIQGTGLGLNIVKNYTELLNGSISFLSKENEGTTFTIIFPKQLKI